MNHLVDILAFPSRQARSFTMCISHKIIYSCGCVERKPVIDLCEGIVYENDCSSVQDLILTEHGNCAYYPTCKNSILRLLELKDYGPLPPVSTDDDEDVQRDIQAEDRQRTRFIDHLTHMRLNLSSGECDFEIHPPAPWRVLHVERNENAAGEGRSLVILKAKDADIRRLSPSVVDAESEPSSGSVASKSLERKPLDPKDAAEGWCEVDGMTADLIF